MVALSFNARERRLVVDGPCWPTDAAGLSRAVLDAVDPTRGLVVDLTRVASVPREVAGALTQACCAAEAEGGRVLVWTLPGSAAEADLAAASRGQSTILAAP